MVCLLKAAPDLSKQIDLQTSQLNHLVSNIETEEDQKFIKFLF
jgi:hypothetical protein